MDVQGAEHLVLSGAAAMLPKIAALWLEVSERPLYEGQRSREQMEALLRARGFTLGFEVRREIEGDQFYANQRHPGNWRYIVQQRATDVIRGARRTCSFLKTRFGNRSAS